VIPTDKGEIYFSNCLLSLDVAVLQFFPLLAPLYWVFLKQLLFLPALQVSARDCTQEIGVEFSFQSSVLRVHTHTLLSFPYLSLSFAS